MSDPFAQPPAEVIGFLARKGVKESWSWRDFAFDEHAVSFTVAKSAGYDIVGDLKAAMQKAVADRLEFAEFQKLVEPTLRAKGWWGRRTVVDPLAGDATDVTLGSPRRLRTIYWANTRTAYGAGQWERAWRTRDVLPYLVYVESTAVHQRELHLTWVGTVLPVEHPWWATHYPPSAWGCVCRVRQASQWEAERSGYDPAAEAPDEGLTYSWINDRTGQVERVPLGVDPGWGGNPGLTRLENTSKLITGKLQGMSEEARVTAARDLAGSPLARAISAGEAPFDPTSELPSQIARGKFEVPVAALDDASAARVATSRTVVTLSVANAAAIRAATPTLAPDWIAALQPAIEAGGLRAGGAGLYLLDLGRGRSATLVETETGLRVTGVTGAD